MSSTTLFDGGRLVESRHCRTLARILGKDLSHWNEIRNALGFSPTDVQEVQVQVKEEGISGENAYYYLIYAWLSRSPKTATLGALVDILGRQLDLLSEANQIMECNWNY